MGVVRQPIELTPAGRRPTLDELAEFTDALRAAGAPGSSEITIQMTGWGRLKLMRCCAPGPAQQPPPPRRPA